MRTTRREKVFGPGRAVPLDCNAKARVAAYARAWSARNPQPGQPKGPITRAFLDVLQALLWGLSTMPIPAAASRHMRLSPPRLLRPQHRGGGGCGGGGDAQPAKAQTPNIAMVVTRRYCIRSPRYRPQSSCVVRRRWCRSESRRQIQVAISAAHAFAQFSTAGG